MSNLKKDIREEILDILRWPYNKRPVRLTQSEALRQQRATDILNLIESVTDTAREDLIEQVRDKKPAKLKSVRGAKNVSSARIGYIGGWNAYYEKLQPILTDIKSKLIDGGK